MDPLIGRILLERYEVLQRIGSGGMGAVYVGRQHAVDRKVALKVLRSDLMSNDHVRQRFRREAEIIAKLSHPNTIQLIDYGETPEGLAVMVMELLVGQSLSERLKTKGPLELADTIRVGREVASSLAEAHLYGLVHRDLKPANIFLAEVGTQMHGKVLDFGIARLLDEEATRLTSTGQVFGTPRYMSPEQAMSTGDVDARSDLYSLGLILYECIVGQPPFVAQTSIQYLSAHTTMAPPKLRERAPDAPEALENLIDACLAKEATDRPQSAEEVQKALERIERSLETGEPAPVMFAPREPATQQDVSRPTQHADPSRPPVTDPPSVPPSPPNRLPLIIAGALAFLAAAAIAAYVAIDPSPAPTTTDAGMLAMNVRDAGTVAAPPPRDAGMAPRDAGQAPRDGGTRVAPPPPPRKKRPPPPPRKKKPPPPPPPPPGGGFVTDPRFMQLDVEDAKVDVVKLAKKCRSSIYGGLAKLTTKGCPDGCAIMVENQCAGLTPADGRAIPPGRKSVQVVCGEKAKKAKRLRFKKNQATVYKCR